MQKYLLMFSLVACTIFIIYGYMNVCPNLTSVERMERADEVFTAKVTKVGGNPSKRYVLLETTRVFKGNVPETQTIKSKPFRVGEEYLIYALRHNGQLLMSKCGGWKNIEEAAIEIKQLENN